MNIKELKEHILMNCSNLSGHRCVKQYVAAMITTKSGDVSYGNNNIANKFEICPRDTAGFKSGEGYHVCIETCNNNNAHKHAEVSAVENALKQGLDLSGATLTLVGHTYCCDNCTKVMQNAGISQVDILLEDSIETIML